MNNTLIFEEIKRKRERRVLKCREQFAQFFSSHKGRGKDYKTDSERRRRIRFERDAATRGPAVNFIRTWQDVRFWMRVRMRAVKALISLDDMNTPGRWGEGMRERLDRPAMA